MKKLSADQKKDKDGHAEAIREAWSKLDGLWGEVEAAVAAYNEGVAEMNEKLSDAETWRDEIVQEMDDYMSERSEKWLDGDAGQNYESWKGEWENVSFESVSELEVNQPDEPSIAEELDNLQVEP